MKKQTETLAAITPAYNESHPYSSFKNIQFDYWGPWLTASHSGVEGGIGAVFSDPTGYQNIRFIAGIESEYETPLGAFQYAYKGFYPTLYVHISQDQELYPYLLREAGGTFYDYAEEVLTVRTGMEIPLIRWDRFFSMQFGYQFQERNFIEKSGDYYRGQTITTNNLSEKSEGAIWARLQYFDGAAFKRSNSIEDGRLVMVTTEKTDPALGGTLSQIRSLGEWNEYISNPWKKNHVLKISGLYGFGDGDRTAQGLFGLGGFESPLPLISLGMPRSVNLQAYDENFQTGDRIVKASLAYRFPIDFFYENISGSAPLFFNQIFGEIFYEGGRTWDDEDEGDDLGWLDSIGLEVNLSFKLFRFLEMAPGLGVLYAPDWSKRSSNKNKQYQIYFTVKGSVNY